MLGRVDPEQRIRYLTLSLYAQAVVERLTRSAKERPADLQNLVDEALEAFEKIRGGGVRAEGVGSRLRAFHYHNQLDFLNSVLNDPKLKIGNEETLKSALEKIRNNPAMHDRKAISLALRFFRHLAAESLRESRRPVEQIPQSVRELCRLC